MNISSQRKNVETVAPKFLTGVCAHVVERSPEEDQAWEGDCISCWEGCFSYL